MVNLIDGKRLEGQILVIDDEATVRETFGEILRTVGFQVLLAADGQEGLKEFQRHVQTIDIILVDMKMPGMNGLQTFAALREIDPQVKVILCSGYSENEIVPQVKDGAITAFLQKPVRIVELLTSIKSALTDGNR